MNLRKFMNYEFKFCVIDSPAPRKIAEAVRSKIKKLKVLDTHIVNEFKKIHEL
jgi:hypothetical protein